jgi:hypothetical protein
LCFSTALRRLKLQVSKPAPLIESKGSQERQTRGDCNTPTQMWLTT